ncbi:MAG: hypothetical protein NC402_02490 [Prevotella sp.]|nr:hypothetical protein [Prevotella sp.]MCM1074670.1 hypothetical protein [Ruminococcus sp.]
MNTISDIWQIMAVALILIACLIYMVVSVRRRFKNKTRSGGCAGCSLIKVCKKPTSQAKTDVCKADRKNEHIRS